MIRDMDFFLARALQSLIISALFLQSSKTTKKERERERERERKRDRKRERNTREN